MSAYKIPNTSYLNHASLLYDTYEFHILAPDGATLTSFSRTVCKDEDHVMNRNDDHSMKGRSEKNET
jgi:hypothetical protein